MMNSDSEACCGSECIKFHFNGVDVASLRLKGYAICGVCWFAGCMNWISNEGQEEGMVQQKVVKSAELHKGG